MWAPRSPLGLRCCLRLPPRRRRLGLRTSASGGTGSATPAPGGIVTLAGRFQHKIRQSLVIKKYEAACTAYPLVSGFTICLIKGSMSDAFAQKVIEKKDKVDWARNAVFATFGGFYGGCAQHLIYNKVYPALFGAGTGFLTVAKKIACDLCVHGPFVTLPTFYSYQLMLLPPKEATDVTMTTEAAPGRSDDVNPSPGRGDRGGNQCRMSVTSVAEFGTEVRDRWKREVLTVTAAYVKVWGPAHVITFGLMPPSLRITWVATCSFFWLIIKSVITHTEYEAGGPAGLAE